MAKQSAELHKDSDKVGESAQKVLEEVWKAQGVAKQESYGRKTEELEVSKRGMEELGVLLKKSAQEMTKLTKQLHEPWKHSVKKVMMTQRNTKMNNESSMIKSRHIKISILAQREIQELESAIGNLIQNAMPFNRMLPVFLILLSFFPGYSCFVSLSNAIS